MKYNIAREKIKNGDILVWSGNSFFSKVIKLFTSSDYSHVGIAYKTRTRLFVIEAMEGYGIRIFPVSRRLPFLWIKMGMGRRWEAEMEEEVMKDVGKSYSYFACFLGWLGVTLKKDHRFQCAEFVGQKFGFAVKSTPAALVTYLEGIGKKIIEVVK